MESITEVEAFGMKVVVIDVPDTGRIYFVKSGSLVLPFQATPRPQTEAERVVSRLVEMGLLG